jgi:hypothetical protein
MNLYDLHSKPESLKHYDCHQETVPDLFWDKYTHQPAELKKREQYIAKHGRYAFVYALRYGRFPAGEAAIAKSPELAYLYARDVIKGPWKPGEKAITTDPLYTYAYARDVIKGRWEPGEEALATDPTHAHMYALHVIKGPFTYKGKTYLPNGKIE